MTVRFGECVFDPETREFFRSGRPVHLPPKSFQLLELLLDRRPKAIAKEELLQLVWPGTFVAEGSLTRVIAELRDAIGDDAREPRLIRTIHGYGYAFQGSASTEARRPKAVSPVFKLIWGDREIALREGENVLGRDPMSLVWTSRACPATTRGFSWRGTTRPWKTSAAKTARTVAAGS